VSLPNSSFLIRQASGDLKRYKMKALKAMLLIAGLITMLTIGAPARAQDGLYDSHHIWRDGAYWHERHPDWVYKYHPDWAVNAGWWQSDHERHPEWFESRFWRDHPMWTYGAYDDHHTWRYADWWHAHDPAWVYSHHPEWAEPYPRWLREDYGRHPEWFRSAYWHEHPHDWGHPYEAYDRYLGRGGEYNKAHYGDSHSHHYAGHEYDVHHGEGWHSAHYDERGYDKHADQWSAHHPPSYSHSYNTSASHSHAGGGSGGGFYKKHQ
jgi:hypothetical protein